MVRDGRLYCSTVLGPRSTPLSAYLMPSGAAQQIAFVGGNTLMPQIPIMVVYHRIDARNGILYLVEGAYIADILARAKASGAQSASVSGGSGGTLTSEGRWLKTAGPAQGRAVAASRSAGFSIAVKSNPARLRADLLVTEIVILVAGLSRFAALVAGYSAGFTPRQRLERQVRAGLRRREFFLEYQPIIELKSGQWVGAEALLRWNHPRLGLVMPGKFINEIEHTTLIGPLTTFILATALGELDAFSLPDGFRVNVNLAPHHTELRSFPEDISSTLTRSATRLQVVLEITERGLLSGLSAVRDSLARLKAQGVKFAVDDFGTANSNISLLQRFPFDYIKIDRQFIDRVASRDRQLIEGISFLANKLGASIVAEGVEEVGQHEALKEIGVAFAQGFLFQRPLGIVEFERMYHRSRIDTT
jgi:EAL domain-containing protein (putative c-di-GMP-specific phosphodiesterase class I)